MVDARRPVRPGKVEKEFEDDFDTTELNISKSNRYIVHRDYAGHYFRYGFAGRLIGNGKKILEIGCGSTIPLVHTMSFGEGFYSNPPALYVGIDYGAITDTMTRKWCKVHEHVDATTQQTRDWLDRVYGKFDVVINFEVIEHMGKEHGAELLKTIHNSLSDIGFAIISTPVFNGAQARNHIYEYTQEELAEAFEAAGFRVKERYGTFMSSPDAKKAIKEKYDVGVANAMLDLYDKVCEFYPPGVAAAYLAPAFPDYARNITWVIEKAR